ncbi:hypothetical protein CAEBREN_08937 [Caenorhabditis brenneri]|uniref:RING-type domain-containing protein n=1 Tax=Caenorhabditis brenneri TaxID=135651 RepID=G0N4R7_CAEBE|nr:hypothetical protein CAEBREN_08937 [Caenorhabditis brenneri]
MADCHVVIQGRPNDDLLGATGTVGLIFDGRSIILVDAGDPWNGAEILQELQNFNAIPSQITHVVITHGHLDHCANLGLFPNATIIMDWDIGRKSKENSRKVEYSVISNWPFKITENCEIKNLTGHTASDTVAIVQDKKNKKLVIYSGDLIEDSQDLPKFENSQLQLLSEECGDDLLLSQEFIFGSADMTEPGPSGCSSQPPAQLQASCAICFEDLRQSDKISALVCGHIYHHGCIAQWIAAKRQCPSCRRNVPKNGFVEKLFFDVQRLDGEAEKQPDIDYREEHFKLKKVLQIEKENVERLDSENKCLKTEIKSLEKKIIKEKDRYRTEVPKLQSTIHQLTTSSEETEYLRNQLKEAKNKVKVTEFYKILTTHSDQAEKQLGEYLRKNGSLDTEKFFQLQKAQISDLADKRREAAREIERLKTDKHSMQKKAREDAATIRTLKQSILELRERANVDTPISNKRLRAVLETETPPAAKRISMGFDDSSQLINHDLSCSEKQENKTPQSSIIPKPSSSSKGFNFESDDDDEYFRTPKLNSKKLDENKKKVVEEVSNVSEDLFDFDIDVPQSIMDRLAAKPAKNVFKLKPTIPKFSKEPILQSRTSVNSSILNVSPPQSMKNGIAAKLSSTTSKPTEKPKSSMESTMKRYQSAGILPKKPSTSSVQKTSRISSFFTRTNSSSSVITEPARDYVTLD